MSFLNKALNTLKTKKKDKDKEVGKETSQVDIDSVNKNKEDERKKEIIQKDEIKKEDKKKETKKELKEDTKDAYKILIKPLVSEKASEAGKLNQYIFIVNPKTNKQEIKKAIFSVYGIKPIKVNVINLQGKKIRFGRIYGKRKDFKKAIVTLPKGKSIQIYEGT